MDELGVTVLKAELEADCKVLGEAAALARQRWAGGREADIEACAFQLARVYNVIEQMGLRVAKAFENRIDDEQGWHSELIQRLTLEIPSVRPAFFPLDLAPDLRDLRGFRHVFRHAYVLKLDPPRVLHVLEAAERVAPRMAKICENFFKQIVL